MRKVAIFLLFLTFIACQDKKTNQSDQIDSSSAEGTNFDWLVGNWQRTNDRAGSQTYEFWKKMDDNQYMGIGFTMVGQDTVFKENLHFYNRRNEWDLAIRGHEDGGNSTIFKLTHKDSISFTVQNLENEFPKEINYATDGIKLNAMISGGGPEIEFSFAKMEQ